MTTQGMEKGEHPKHGIGRRLLKKYAEGHPLIWTMSSKQRGTNKIIFLLY